MNALTLTITEFSRGLSDFLSQVQYQGQTLDIQRGKKVIARVLPAAVADGFPIDQLDDALTRAPQLSQAERAAMVDDLGLQRANLIYRGDPWAL